MFEKSVFFHVYPRLKGKRAFPFFYCLFSNMFSNFLKHLTCCHGNGSCLRVFFEEKATTISRKSHMSYQNTFRGPGKQSGQLSRKFQATYMKQRRRKNVLALFTIHWKVIEEKCLRLLYYCYYCYITRHLAYTVYITLLIEQTYMFMEACSVEESQ